MPEILTESFCERCGTRYTFESVAPRKTRKLGQFKTLSKGVKNWVMSDDSSLDEAMAAARSDEERALTAHQLDAFHSTFNFCMNCRQYTCANCWNQAEGRCLSCSPNLGDELLAAAFPDATAFEPVRMDAGAWPQADLATPATDGAGLGLAGLPTNGTDDRANDATGLRASDATAPEGDATVLAEDVIGAPEPVSDEVRDFDAVARLAFLAGDAPADDAAEVPAAAAEVPAAAERDAEPAAEWSAESVAAESVGLEVEPELATDDVAAPVDDRAAELAARTADLLGRFRPGQSIDAELEAYEAAIAAQSDDVASVAADGGAGATDAVAAVPEDVAAEPEVVARDEQAAVAAELAVPAEEPAAAFATTAEVEVEAEDSPSVAEAEPEPELVAAAEDASTAAAEAEAEEIEPVAAAADATEIEPVAAESEPERAAAAADAPEPSGTASPGEDRIEQPTWRIFAPEPTRPAGDGPAPTPASPDQVPVQASGEPQWPARREFIESPSMALLADRARASSEAIWAASAREVAGPPRSTGPTMTPAPPGIQPCSNCGLSLSATARFCRRCGTRQG